MKSHLLKIICCFLLAVFFFAESAASDQAEQVSVKRKESMEENQKQNQKQNQSDGLQKIKLNLKISGDLGAADRELIANEVKTFLSKKLKEENAPKEAKLKINLETKNNFAKLNSSYEAEEENPQADKGFSSFTWSAASSFNYSKTEEIVAQIKKGLEDLFAGDSTNVFDNELLEFDDSFKQDLIKKLDQKYSNPQKLDEVLPIEKETQTETENQKGIWL